jgi:hypothetical protein
VRVIRAFKQMLGFADIFEELALLLSLPWEGEDDAADGDPHIALFIQYLFHGLLNNLKTKADVSPRSLGGWGNHEKPREA